MTRHKSTVFGISALTLFVGLAAWHAGCSLEFFGGEEVRIGILNKLVTITFRSIGTIAAKDDEMVRVPSAIRLFEEAPPQTPASAQMTLPSTSIGVAQRLGKSAAHSAKALPLNGTAKIRFRIAPGQSAELCGSATLLAEFDLVLITGTPAIVDEVFDLSGAAIAAMMANDVTICIEVESDFDADVVIDQVIFGFGGMSASERPPSVDIGPGLQPNGYLQVPIDNRGGRARRAPVNRTVGGINYGIVGVLEAATPAVTVPAGEAATMIVDPLELGLISVSTLYLATHSSYVPDLPNGVHLATMTVTYKDGGAATVDFVLGTNTAEWSYERREHQVNHGGVQHARPASLYTFQTSVDSTMTYNGHVYGVTVPVDTSRTIRSISLAMVDPAQYAGMRTSAGALANWAGQAVTAITLLGIPLPPAKQACCSPDGGCADVVAADCAAHFGGGGLAQGEGTECATSSCAGGNPTEPEACCLPPIFAVATTDPDPNGFVCEMIDGTLPWTTRADCTSVGGVPQGPGTNCANVSCPEFYACCLPPTDDTGYVCAEMLFDECVNQGGDPQAAGVRCTQGPCRAACCFDTGDCEDLVPETCEDFSGTPGPAESTCAFTECLGACCLPDGCCELMSLEACTSAGGVYQGFAVDCTPDLCTLYGCFSVHNFLEPARYMTVRSACDYESTLLADLPGGGSDPTALALILDDVMPGMVWPTRVEAARECCKLLGDLEPADGAAGLSPTGAFKGIVHALDPILYDECEPVDDFVVWFTGNVCCWGAPWIYVTTRSEFEAPRLQSSFAGGGINPETLAIKVEVMGGFDSVDEAKAWICPRFESWTSHYWCGGHLQWAGQNWRSGNLGCDISDLPTPAAYPETNGCAAYE